MAGQAVQTPTPPHQHYDGGRVLGGRICTHPRCWTVVNLGLVVMVEEEVES